MASLKALSKSKKTKEEPKQVAPPPPPEEEAAPEEVAEEVEQPPVPPKQSPKKSPSKGKQRRRRSVVDEEEEAPQELIEEEGEAVELAKYENIPAIPTKEDVESNLDAWRAYSDELQRLIAEVEGSDADSAASGSAGSDMLSETEEEEDEEPGEDEEKEQYVAETLETRKERATVPLEWQCYAMDLPAGPRKAEDVACCRGDFCAYTVDPSLLTIAAPKRGKGLHVQDPVSGEWIAINSARYRELEKNEETATALKAAPTAEPYKESYRLLGTDVYVCDRCYTEAKQKILEEQRKAKAGEEEEEGGESTKKKGKGKGKKADEEDEAKETPLVIAPEINEAIEAEYTALGLPREPKVITKKPRRAAEEEEEEESDVIRVADVSDDEDF